MYTVRFPIHVHRETAPAVHGCYPSRLVCSHWNPHPLKSGVQPSDRLAFLGDLTWINVPYLIWLQTRNYEVNLITDKNTFLNLQTRYKLIAGPITIALGPFKRPCWDHEADIPQKEGKHQPFLSFISYDDVYITNGVYIFIRNILWSCTVVFLRIWYECVFYYVLGQRWPNKQVKSILIMIQSDHLHWNRGCHSDCFIINGCTEGCQNDSLYCYSFALSQSIWYQCIYTEPLRQWLT